MTRRRIALSWLVAALPLFGQFKTGDQATFGFDNHYGSVYALLDGATYPPKTENTYPFTSTNLADPFANLTNPTFSFPGQGVTVRIESVTYQKPSATIQGKFNVDSGCCVATVGPLNPQPEMRIVVQGVVTVTSPTATSTLTIRAGNGNDTSMCGESTNTRLNMSGGVSFKWDSGSCLLSSVAMNYTGLDTTTGVYNLASGLNINWSIDFRFGGLSGDHTVLMTLYDHMHFKPCPGGNCGASPDIKIKTIRVTQTVQNSANAVPMVAGKKTVVRAWVQTVNSTEPASDFTGSSTLSSMARNSPARGWPRTAEFSRQGTSRQSGAGTTSRTRPRRSTLRCRAPGPTQAKSPSLWKSCLPPR